MRDHLGRVGLHDEPRLEELVATGPDAVADAYRSAVTAELVGDLDNWRPTGIQAISSTPNTVIRGDWAALSRGQSTGNLRWDDFSRANASVSADWTSTQDQLNTLAESARKITAALKPPPACACGEMDDEFWEHSEEGCEFIPHQVELAHVE
jgi:hypothetical protein